MKKVLAVVAVVLLAALLVMPGPASGEMFVEAYLGGGGAASDSLNPSYGGSRTLFGNVFTTNGTASIPGRFDNPYFIGGLKIGAWFDKSGVLAGVNFPDWMKYFGFWLDFSYHRLDYREQLGTYSQNYFINGVPLFNPVQGGLTWWSDGKVATFAFMFGARYGFLPDKDVPFGRLQPYIAVGPALMIVSQKRGFRVDTITSIGGIPVGIPMGVARDLGEDTDVVLGLAVEAGLRWMVLKNVSFDASFKYRWAEPSFTGSWNDVTFPTGDTSTIEPTYHLFSGQVGVAYHF